MKAAEGLVSRELVESVWPEAKMFKREYFVNWVAVTHPPNAQNIMTNYTTIIVLQFVYKYDSLHHMIHDLIQQNVLAVVWVLLSAAVSGSQVSCSSGACRVWRQ